MSSRVGGIRIEKIKSPISTTRYIYEQENGTSSGLLTREVIFSNVCEMHLYNNDNVGMIYFVEFRTSPYQFIENPFTGGYMGYSRVVVERGSGAEKQTDIYGFYNEKEPILEYFDIGRVMPLNGNLVTHKAGDALNEVYLYQAIKMDSLTSHPGDNRGYQQSYTIDSYFSYLKNHITSVIGTDNGASQTTVVSYDYNPTNYQVSKTTTKVTGQPEKRHEVKYSSDFPQYNGGTFANNNLVAVPVQEDFYTDGTLTHRLIHTYHNSPFVKPWQEYVYHNVSGNTLPTFNITDTYRGKAEMTYSAYTSKGRVTEMRTRMGQPVVLLWSYHHQYAVAQITNATLEQVVASGINVEALADKAQPSDGDWALLHALRSKLPQANVVINQYEPLVGVVSQTDASGATTRYTYDDFNRLRQTIEVTGSEENILQQIDYKYATE